MIQEQIEHEGEGADVNKILLVLTRFGRWGFFSNENKFVVRMFLGLHKIS